MGIIQKIITRHKEKVAQRNDMCDSLVAQIDDALKERGIQVHLFVRKNKDDKISKEFYYFGYMQASGKVKEFIMPNTDKTAVEIEWLLDVPVTVF